MRDSIKRIEACNWERNVSKIWKLVKASLPLIKDHLRWQAGNDHINSIETDSFVFEGPLQIVDYLRDLRN